MPLKTPRPVETEHDELLGKSKKAAESRGREQEAAKAVVELLKSHFEAEEEYVLPPLGLLSALAHGTVPTDSEKALRMVEKLMANLEHLIEEHHEIEKAMKKLIREAPEEDKFEHEEFAKELNSHAEEEEEILFPAALLIGEYLRVRMEMKEERTSKREAAGAR
jgi:hemerythrin superfamily protein